jgi:hypothetical protein
MLCARGGEAEVEREDFGGIFNKAMTGVMNFASILFFLLLRASGNLSL